MVLRKVGRYCPISRPNGLCLCERTMMLVTHALLFLVPWSLIAGESAEFTDAAYVEAGAVVVQGIDQIFSDADIITKIRPPEDNEVPKLAGKTLISTIQPAINGELYEKLTSQNTNVFALDCVPRMLSRGQSYDILSSQANIAGYRSVIEAAEAFPRFFAGQMTAAGKVPPAKVLVLGAGVAGLAAIQTGRLLVFDSKDNSRGVSNFLTFAHSPSLLSPLLPCQS